VNNHFDVLIVGAGISGIGAGYHLQTKCPKTTYAVLEGRKDLGGTWDLFKYPGIRSDSDMFTLGFSFKPWTEAKSIADGPAILKYLHETAEEYGIKERILFEHKVIDLSWSSSDCIWSVKVEMQSTKEIKFFSCNFLSMCSGYYDYNKGYEPKFKGSENFSGDMMHPQKWRDDIVYKDKKVVIIGSGATAVTLVPAMAKDAKHVTMLQRSPTYVVQAPEQDLLAIFIRKYFTASLSHFLVRWRNILRGQFYFRLCKKYPQRIKKIILEGVKNALGENYDIKKHFTPRYNPWDQRMCLVPNGDLFESINSQKASVVTEHINSFVKNGILLESGEILEADLIVTATGLNIQMLAGINIEVDKVKVDFSKTVTYKGMMFSGVPNLVNSFGYINASWTLRSDLTCEFLCRLINHMDAQDYRQCRPLTNDEVEEENDMLDFSSGYLTRAINILPKQGTKSPWRNYQNYLLDIFDTRFGSFKDGALNFSSLDSK
tara:strand:- start:4613 stop:6076 length:1464 start_codon:yes stop_codon:yes gene_type:complete